MSDEYFHEEDWEVAVGDEENFSNSEIQILQILLNENITDLEGAEHVKNMMNGAFAEDVNSLIKYKSFISGTELSDIFEEKDKSFCKYGDFDPADILMLQHDIIRCNEIPKVPLTGDVSFLAATSHAIADNAFMGEKHGGYIECAIEDAISDGYFDEEDWEVAVGDEENFSNSEIQILQILLNENITDLEGAEHVKNMMNGAFAEDVNSLIKYKSFISGTELSDIFEEKDKSFCKYGDFDPADILMLQHDIIRCNEIPKVPLTGDVSFLAATSHAIADNAFMGEKHGGYIECAIEDAISDGYFDEEDWEVAVGDEENFSNSEIQILQILLNENITDLEGAEHVKNMMKEAFTDDVNSLIKYKSFISGTELSDIFEEKDKSFCKYGDFDPADILMLQHDIIRCNEIPKVPSTGVVSFLAATSSTIANNAFMGEKHGGDIECALEDTISNLSPVYGQSVGSIPEKITGKKFMVENVTPLYCTKIDFSVVKKNAIVGNEKEKTEPIELLQGQQKISFLTRCTKVKLCRVPKCSSLSRQNGVCARHGAKLKKCSFSSECTNVAVKCGVCRRHGAKKKKNKKCDFSGCNKEAKKGGICYKHGAERKICFFSECTNVAIKGGVCKKHGVQLNVNPMGF